MNRPNLYYPSGSTAPIYVLGGATPQALAGTVANSRLFAQPSTKLFLSTTVPPLTLNEGGMIRMLDGSTLVMNQEAIVNAATATITMANGGKLLSGGGTQIGPSFADGAVYTIPAARLKMPLEINLQRSVTLPAGYMIPTMPRVLTQPPYVRLPVAPPAP
jgi:hypothetical protein